MTDIILSNLAGAASIPDLVDDSAGGLSITRAIFDIGVPRSHSCQIKDFLCSSIGLGLVINTAPQILSSTLCCSDRLNPSPLFCGGITFHLDINRECQIYTQNAHSRWRNVPLF